MTSYSLGPIKLGYNDYIVSNFDEVYAKIIIYNKSNRFKFFTKDRHTQFVMINFMSQFGGCL